MLSLLSTVVTQHNPYAPAIIIGFLLGTIGLYVVPKVISLFRPTPKDKDASAKH